MRKPLIPGETLTRFAAAVEQFANLPRVESTTQVEAIFREVAPNIWTIPLRDVYAYRQQHRAARLWMRALEAIDPGMPTRAEAERVRLRRRAHLKLRKHKFEGHCEFGPDGLLQFAPRETRSVEAIIYSVLMSLLEKGSRSRAHGCEIEGCKRFVIFIRPVGKRGAPRKLCPECQQDAQNRYNRAHRAKAKS